MATGTTTLNGKTVFYQTDQYGEWICVQNYEHLGGNNPSSEVTPVDTFPQLPNGLSDDSTINNLGSNGELRHVDDIDQYGTWNIDAVRLEGYTDNHSRKIHFFTTNSNVVNAVLTEQSAETNYTDYQGSETTLYSDHTANLPASAANGNADTRSDRIFGAGFPFYNSGTEHWAVAGSGSRWAVDDYSNDFSNTTVHRVWVRVPDGTIQTLAEDISTGTAFQFDNAMYDESTYDDAGVLQEVFDRVTSTYSAVTGGKVSETELLERTSNTYTATVFSSFSKTFNNFEERIRTSYATTVNTVSNRDFSLTDTVSSTVSAVNSTASEILSLSRTATASFANTVQSAATFTFNQFTDVVVNTYSAVVNTGNINEWALSRQVNDYAATASSAATKNILFDRVQNSFSDTVFTDNNKSVLEVLASYTENVTSSVAVDFAEFFQRIRTSYTQAAGSTSSRVQDLIKTSASWVNPSDANSLQYKKILSVANSYSVAAVSTTSEVLKKVKSASSYAANAVSSVLYDITSVREAVSHTQSVVSNAFEKTFARDTDQTVDVDTESSRTSSIKSAVSRTVDIVTGRDETADGK